MNLKNVKSFVNGPLQTKTAHLHCIPFLEICLILKDLFDGYGKRREGTKCTTQTLNIPSIFKLVDQDTIILEAIKQLVLMILRTEIVT
jgi:hypothetical protein